MWAYQSSFLFPSLHSFTSFSNLLPHSPHYFREMTVKCTSEENRDYHMNKYFLPAITSKNLSVPTLRPFLTAFLDPAFSWLHLESLCSEHAPISSTLETQMLEPKLLLSFWFCLPFTTKLFKRSGCLCYTYLHLFWPHCPARFFRPYHS